MVGQDAWIAVYIVASARNGTLYTGVTSQLPSRVQQHKLGTTDGFTRQYGCKTLVWYEDHPFMPEAIRREKQIKRWRRAWKLALIEGGEPRVAGSVGGLVRCSRGATVLDAALLDASSEELLGPGSARSLSAWPG